MPSYREGLSRAIMEAMASGIPVIASKIRGNTDLIKDNEGGFLCDCNNAKSFSIAIETLMKKDVKERMGNFNLELSKEFDLENIKTKLKYIYEEQLNCTKIENR